ncbi:MAG TPA: T9SS type A sorting domain-containing protein, partial [Saprospiraceae bacterium]|nr:T9SS type A sorting domain-containing protein [Saprospiraceae bacterium]
TRRSSDLKGLGFDRSYDQGETWMDTDIIINDIPGGWDFDIEGISRCNGLPVTVCDLSDGPYRGNIYINWTDQRNGENDTDVWVVKSEDEGNTWSDPIRVNDDLPGRQQFFTWMTVDQKTGYLYFVFYDRRNYDDQNTDVYMAVSRDGGESFENFKISESPFDPNKNVFFGDYTNISAYDNIVRPIWTRLDNHKLSLWTALIDLENTTDSEDTEFKNDLLYVDSSPNPVKNKLAISFKLRQSTQISIILFDSLGNKINNIIDKKDFSLGKHIIEIDIQKNNLKPGIYFYTIKYAKYIKTKKFVVPQE